MVPSFLLTPRELLADRKSLAFQRMSGVLLSAHGGLIASARLASVAGTIHRRRLLLDRHHNGSLCFQLQVLGAPLRKVYAKVDPRACLESP